MSCEYCFARVATSAPARKTDDCDAPKLLTVTDVWPSGGGCWIHVSVRKGSCMISLIHLQTNECCMHISKPPISRIYYFIYLLLWKLYSGTVIVSVSYYNVLESGFYYNAITYWLQCSLMPIDYCRYNVRNGWNWLLAWLSFSLKSLCANSLPSSAFVWSIISKSVSSSCVRAEWVLLKRFLTHFICNSFER